MSAIENGKPTVAIDLVKYETGKVNHRVVVENPQGVVIAMAMDKDTFLPEHSAPAQLLVQVIEGQIEFTLQGHAHTLSQGTVLAVAPNEAHKVHAIIPSKLLLTKLNRI